MGSGHLNWSLRARPTVKIVQKLVSSFTKVTSSSWTVLFLPIRPFGTRSAQKNRFLEDWVRGGCMILHYEVFLNVITRDGHCPYINIWVYVYEQVHFQEACIWHCFGSLFFMWKYIWILGKWLFWTVGVPDRLGRKRKRSEIRRELR